MAETTLLRSSANVRNASPNATASKPSAQLSGAHPVVQVNMNSGGPQIQGAQQARQGVMILPPKAGTRNFMTGGLPNQPAKQGVVILPPKEQHGVTPPSMTADQLLLCRHLADKYLGELRANVDGVQVEGAEMSDNVKLAETTIVAIDTAMAAMTAAAAVAAAMMPPPRMAAVAVPPRTVAAGPRPSQAVLSATPRRVARPAPVVVAMDAGRPIIQTDPTSQPDLDPTSQPIPSIPIEGDTQG